MLRKVSSLLAEGQPVLETKTGVSITVSALLWRAINKPGVLTTAWSQRDTRDRRIRSVVLANGVLDTLHSPGRCSVQPEGHEGVSLTLSLSPHQGTLSGVTDVN